MSRRPSCNVLFVALMLSVVGAGVAVGQQLPPPEPDDQQAVTTKGQQRVPATTIDFNDAYGLPYSSLGTLGARIEAARKAGDPVGLAHAANELAVAEQVSGKKAPITANDVWNETIQLANMRRQVAELKAMVHMTQQQANLQAQANELKKNLASAEQLAKTESDAARAGKEIKAVAPRITIHNNTDQYADVYVNGHFQIRVAPYESKWFVVEHKWNPTVLTGYGSGSITWGPRYIWGTFATYAWNLN
ncbi:MAG: hypothetical protein ACK4RK_12905 [Gemmataceae bacterium]